MSGWSTGGYRAVKRFRGTLSWWIYDIMHLPKPAELHNKEREP